MNSTGRVFLAACGWALLTSIAAPAGSIVTVPDAAYNGMAQTDGTFKYLTAPGSVTNTSGGDSDTVTMSAQGPLISSTATLSGSGNALVVGETTLTYYVEFVGPTASLPIDIVATGSISSSLGWNNDSLVAGLTLSASQPTGPNYNDLAHLVCNYEASEICSDGPHTLNVDSTYTFAANVPIAVTLFEEVGGSSSLSGTVTGSLDPMLSIDASFANAGAYTVVVSAGVTQSLTQTSGVSAQPVAAFLDQFGAPALSFNGSTSFPDAGGLLINTPGVAQASDGDVYVVGLDSAGGVHLNSYNYGSAAWNGWQYSGGILDTSSGLTAAVDPNGVVWFTGRDIGNRFWINSWNGATFGGWTLVANGIFASDSVPQIAIPSDGSIYVIGKDIGGRIWSNSYVPTSHTFTGWVDRQAVMTGQPSATAGQDGMVYVAVRSVSTNSPVYITQIPAQNAATANTWLNGGGLIDTNPQITSEGGAVCLMAEAGGNTVYLLTFSEASQTFGTWSFTNGVLNDATIAAAAGNVYIAGRDGADRIYWYSLTGNSWFLAGGAGISSTVLSGGK